MTNHCGSCKHLNVTGSHLAHNKLGWYRCLKINQMATFVHATKATACEMYIKVEDINARRKLISERLK